MFDDFVVGIQLVQVELKLERVGVGGEACSPDEGGEVWDDIVGFFETGDEDGDCIGFSGAGADVVVCCGVWAGARGANYIRKSAHGSDTIRNAGDNQSVHLRLAGMLSMVERLLMLLIEFQVLGQHPVLTSACCRGFCNLKTRITCQEMQ